VVLPIAGYRRQNLFRILVFPQTGLGSRHDGIRSSPRCKNFQSTTMKSVESILTISIKSAGFHLEDLQGGLKTNHNNIRLLFTICFLQFAVSALFTLYIYYIIFFYKMQIFLFSRHINN